MRFRATKTLAHKIFKPTKWLAVIVIVHAGGLNIGANVALMPSHFEVLMSLMFLQIHVVAGVDMVAAIG